MAFSTIRPYQFVALRLPSDTIKVEQLLPNSLINLGKYGSFHTNNLFGRPYNLTFEILDRGDSSKGKELRIVPAAELHATTLLEEAEADAEDGGDTSTPNGEVAEPTRSVKSNVNIIDNQNNQKLTMTEIEALKQDEMGSTKDLIAKIMQSHSALDQKTAFSLAKYTLRKHKKYSKRFCVLPLDVAMLTEYMMEERDASKVMELRDEAIGLIGCWANVHADGQSVHDSPESSRYLVVDDTGGLTLAAVAERMGILHQLEHDPHAAASVDEDAADGEEDQHITISIPHKPKRQQYSNQAMSGTSNSITMIHSNQQPNLALLRYFNFDANNPNPSHPLYSQLKTLSWLQLLEPESDSAYQEPSTLSQEQLSALKSSRRSAYFRKRRRWERTKHVIDEARAGEFNGLVVTSYTSPVSILRHLVPLLAGGSQVVVYSPHIEPLVELADLYSTARRTAFLNRPEGERIVPSEDFPVNPTQLLSPMVQTSRVRKWQVLPGRTHPLMTGKGGAEGYVFVATRVLPAGGKVSARGRAVRGKKSRGGTSADGQSVAALDQDSDVDGEDLPNEKRLKTETAEALLPMDEASEEAVSVVVDEGGNVMDVDS